MVTYILLYGHRDGNLIRSGWTVSTLGIILYETTQLAENRAYWRHTGYHLQTCHVKKVIAFVLV